MKPTVRQNLLHGGLLKDTECAGESTSLNADRLWNDHEVAKYLGTSVATLRRRRRLQQPPVFIRIGGSVRYRWLDIQTFVAQQPRGGKWRRLWTAGGAFQTHSLASGYATNDFFTRRLVANGGEG